jgi:hypothetical protein
MDDNWEISTFDNLRKTNNDLHSSGYSQLDLQLERVSPFKGRTAENAHNSVGSCHVNLILVPFALISGERS